MKEFIIAIFFLQSYLAYQGIKQKATEVVSCCRQWIHMKHQALFFMKDKSKKKKKKKKCRLLQLCLTL